MWLLNYLLASAGPLAMGLFPTRLLLIGIGLGLVEIVAGTLVGARFYTEAESFNVRAAGAR
jgi:hypothetical protein